MNYVAFSGGKDSTALVLRLAGMGEDFACIFTPAGNEPEAVFAHVAAIGKLTGREVIQPPTVTLMHLILSYRALPNWRQRWCTRQIKIEPCIAFLLDHPDSTLYVGLRADEEARPGIYGDFAKIRFPMREWGWDEADVWKYLDAQGVTIPPRTNCKLCYGQQLGEWYALWRDDPTEWERGEVLEAHTGHTFRSPGRDTWPASLKDLRARFEAGDIPRGAPIQERLFGVCRECRM